MLKDRKLITGVGGGAEWERKVDKYEKDKDKEAEVTFLALGNTPKIGINNIEAHKSIQR